MPEKDTKGSLSNEKQVNDDKVLVKGEDQHCRVRDRALERQSQMERAQSVIVKTDIVSSVILMTKRHLLRVNTGQTTEHFVQTSTHQYSTILGL